MGGGKLYAVVKADAYGHGAEEVARALEEIADGFCVAVMEEGIALRAAGVEKPVLVFAPPLDGYDAARAAFYDLTVTVNGVHTARLAGGCRCHIKVNTGMNRLGCGTDELPAVLDALDEAMIDGVYSHLYAPADRAASLRQLALFERAEQLVRRRRADVFAHLAASGGLLRGGRFLKDGVRCGILLYGYAPQGFARQGFVPALRVYARRVQTTRFIGGGVGYHAAERPYGTLCTYRLGYADGFARGAPLGEYALCMDAFVREGGGKMACVFSDADEYAARCGTIAYEALTAVTRRSERVYLR